MLLALFDLKKVRNKGADSPEGLYEQLAEKNH